jgi:tetratricopeptide (TPR) repeat protein
MRQAKRMSTDAENLFEEANHALDRKQYAIAEKFQRQALTLLELHSEDASRIAAEVEKLAGIHFQQAKFGLAASEYQRVLKLREGSLPISDPQILRVLHCLGKSYFNEMKYDLAEAAFRNALAASETQSDSSRDVAQFLYELGFLLYYVGRYREAEPQLLRALRLYETLQGPNHPDTVYVLERIALNYENCPEIGKDPEPYFQKAVEALKADTENKYQYVANLCRWAGCIAARERFEQADKLFTEVLALIDASYQQNPEWHWIVSNCVEYLESRGKGDLVAHLKAKELDYDAYGDVVRQRLEHAERTLSDNDPELAAALLNAGNHAIFQQNYPEAEALLRRALDSNLKVHGEESEAVVVNLNRLCVVARELKNFDEAESAIQRAFEIAKKSFPNSQVCPRTMETLALLREAQGRTEEATELYNQAVVIFEQLYGYPSYEVIECCYRQSGHLFRAGKFADAENAIRRVTGAMDKIDAVSDYERSDYMATLASVLRGLGREKESEDAGKRADELLERAQRDAVGSE